MFTAWIENQIQRLIGLIRAWTAVETPGFALELAPVRLVCGRGRSDGGSVRSRKGGVGPPGQPRFFII